MDIKKAIEKDIGYSGADPSLPLSKQLVRKLSAKKEGLDFDKKIGDVILDGFFEDDTRMLFVTSKCDEPYEQKPPHTSHQHPTLYDYINKSMPYDLSIFVANNTSETKNDSTVFDFFAQNERIVYFDIAEMIDILFETAKAILDKRLPTKQLDFIYLFYDPTELELSTEQKEKLESIYERLCYEINLIEFDLLLRTVLLFLRQEHGYEISYEEIKDIAFKFTFSLASQLFYPILIGTYNL